MGEMQPGVVYGGNIACLQPGVVFWGTVAEGGKVCVVSIIYIVIALFSAAELTRCTCVLYSLAGYLKRRMCGPTHLYFVGKMQNLDGVKNKPKKTSYTAWNCIFSQWTAMHMTIFIFYFF